MPGEPVSCLTYEGRADQLCLEHVHDLVDQLWVEVPDVAPLDRYAYETAVIEVVGNIVEHGGPDVRLRMRVVVEQDRMEADVRDTGPAVELPEPAGLPQDPLAEGGRGLALARAVADAVTYERAGGTNCWRVVKWRSGAR